MCMGMLLAAWAIANRFGEDQPGCLSDRDPPAGFSEDGLATLRMLRERGLNSGIAGKLWSAGGRNLPRGRISPSETAGQSATGGYRSLHGREIGGLLQRRDQPPGALEGGLYLVQRPARVSAQAFWIASQGPPAASTDGFNPTQKCTAPHRS